MGYYSREFASLIQTRTQYPRYLTDNTLTGQESLILLACKMQLFNCGRLTQFLNQLLVFIQFLEFVYIHAGDIICLGFVAMLLVSKYTHRKLWSWSVLQST